MRSATFFSAVLMSVGVAALPMRATRAQASSSALSPTQLIDPLGGLALGAGLQMFADEVNTIVNTAGTNGKLIAIEAGKQLWLTINNAKLAYADEREKTFKQLNVSVQGNIQTLYGALQTFKIDGFAKSEEILKGAQQVANTLPMSNKEPQVTGYAPYFIITAASSVQPASAIVLRAPQAVTLQDARPSARIDTASTAVEFLGGEFNPIRPTATVIEDPVRLEVNGNFVWAPKKGFTPLLLVGPDTVRPVVTTTSKLMYLVTRKVIGAPDPTKAGYTRLQVAMPYQTGWWLWKKRRQSTFDLLLASLPPEPGVIEMVGQVPGVTTLWRSRATELIRQHSNDDDLDLAHCGPAPIDGFQIEPTSVAFHAEWWQGKNPDDWRYFQASTNPAACYRVQTVHRVWGTSGKANFRLGWREYKEVTISTPKTDSFSLTWGGSRAFTYAPGQWKLIFRSFDGQVQEIVNATGPQNRFLRLAVTPTDVTVYFPRAEELRW